MSHIGVTEREGQVLRLLVQGLTTRQIALHMRLSERTAYMHIRNLKLRLGATTRSQLVHKAQVLCPHILHDPENPNGC